MSAQRTPTLGEVAKSHVQVALERLRVAQPARVESYDDGTRRAEVSPLLKVPVRDEDGEVTWAQLPRLPSVPVLMPGAGGLRLKLPVAEGDVVLLVFCDFSIDGWKAGEGAADPTGVVQPGTLGTHQVADAIAIPCLFDAGSDSPADAIEIQPDGTVVVDQGAQQLVRGNAYRGAEDTFFAALEVVVDAVGVAFAADSGLLPVPKAAVAAAIAAFDAAKAAFDATAGTHLSRNKTS